MTTLVPGIRFHTAPVPRLFALDLEEFAVESFQPRFLARLRYDEARVGARALAALLVVGLFRIFAVRHDLLASVEGDGRH